MNLTDCIKKKDSQEQDIERVVNTFKKNEDLYKGKSDKFIIRITADELGIRKDDLCDILAEHYED